MGQNKVVKITVKGYRIRVAVGVNGDFNSCWITDLNFQDLMKLRGFLQDEADKEIESYKKIWGQFNRTDESDPDFEPYGRNIGNLKILNTYLERKRKLAPKVKLFDF